MNLGKSSVPKTPGNTVPGGNTASKGIAGKLSSKIYIYIGIGLIVIGVFMVVGAILSW